VDVGQIQAAFDDVFDQAVVFHGYADYMRDYEVFVFAVADPSTGVQPQHMRYRFKNCVGVTATTALSAQIWRVSLDERLVDYQQGRDLDGFVWGVKWQDLCPGMRLLEGSAEASRWSRDIGIPFYEAEIGMNGHHISLVFADLLVDTVRVGHAPFVVSDGEPGPESAM